MRQNAASRSGQPQAIIRASWCLVRHVTVDYDKRDRYGRIVGKVLIFGSDANLKQVEAGLVWHYKAYQNEQNPLDRPHLRPNRAAGPQPADPAYGKTLNPVPPLGVAQTGFYRRTRPYL